MKSHKRTACTIKLEDIFLELNHREGIEGPTTDRKRTLIATMFRKLLGNHSISIIIAVSVSSRERIAMSQYEKCFFHILLLLCQLSTGLGGDGKNQNKSKKSSSASVLTSTKDMSYLNTSLVNSNWTNEYQGNIRHHI